MFFRQAGIHHTSYVDDTKLFPLPFDRWLLVIFLIAGLVAPYVMDALYLTSYMVPWLIWTAAALGLNLLMGWAGQFHFGYAAVMGIGAYAAVHATKAGVPFEFALIIGGLIASLLVIGNLMGSV